MVQLAAGTPSRGGALRYLGPFALSAVVAITTLVVLSARAHPHASAASPRQAAAPHSSLGYWTVKPGDTLTAIAAKTGVTVTVLEGLNPDVNPSGLQPGERLKLSANPPAPPPKPPGPKFWTVRPGQSFGYIAAKTGIDIDLLERLNRSISPSALQPGQVVQLRP